MEINRETLKFGALVGLSAIFIDAAIAHGLWWENDPYWTYWITKSFLITTVFTLGTAAAGTGLIPGIVITLFHTIILELYYDFLAPIGLPQESWWLGFRDLWMAGFFVHYVSILSGYLLALWIWRQSKIKVLERVESTWLILVIAVILVTLDALITNAALLGTFPGITFYIQRLLLAFIFISFWNAYIGFNTSGIIGASLLLSLLWTTYSMYLGPVGLPSNPPEYLNYTDLWLKSFPGGFIAILVGLFLLSRSRLRGSRIRRTMTSAVLIASLIPLANIDAAPRTMNAAASASGASFSITGSDPYAIGNREAASGSIAIAAENVGDRWSHIQNTDIMDVEAHVTAHGDTYDIRITKPMVRHPELPYPLWMGVALDHEMHGDTGVGTSKIPKVNPEIALWGWAEVRKNGAMISALAPAHVMVMTKKPNSGITLEVAAENKSLIGAPNGYLHVLWEEIDHIETPASEKQNREIFGFIILFAIGSFFGTEAIRTNRESRKM